MSAIIMTSCKMSAFKNGIKGNGKVVSKEVKIEDYNSINLGGKFDLVYEQKVNEEAYLRFEIDENLQEYASATVKDGKLTIKSTQEINPKHYKVYTNSTALSELSTSGMNNVELRDSINSENLDIYGSGMGDIQAMNLNCTNLNVHTSGMVDITLGGETVNTTMSVSGKGSINAYNLKSQNANCSVSGIGSIKLYASEMLSAKVSGIGKINYKGNPKETNLSKSGIGGISAKE